MESQRGKTTGESGGIKGYDEGKQVKVRKRHVLVDTRGLLLSVDVTPAHTSDQEGARRLLIGLKPLQPRLEHIWADSAYRGEALATWCAAAGAWRVEIIKPAPHVQGFVVRPWCWIVERSITDAAVVAFATATGRAVVTFNRRHFIRLHTEVASHAGLIVCTRDDDVVALADRIHHQLQRTPTLQGQLLRITRPSS